jgi:aspartyl-tRNA(Asn)/glutamyl-tRNA(Gln) amidotransferase subunit B
MSQAVATDYETIIGLEVHAQLRTHSKMYCRCAADYASAPPNTHVCPVCLGLPGVLPTINGQAVEYTILTALALNCAIPDYTKFDRKNYPYPDLMKGYQISQYDQPLGVRGWLIIEVNGENRRIGVTRVHLEEDVAKLLHRNEYGESYSLMDVNRAGVPLMEIVSEPDMRTPEEARQYLLKLHAILSYLGVSTANMEEGSFRCDANISIRPAGSTGLLAKVEVKNMNSFRAVYRALEYEAERQRVVVAEGGRIVQETRGWVEAEGKTVSQRSKEFAHDYRYFPEPDLPPLTPSADWVDEIRACMPELPEAKRDRLVAQYKLPLYDASLLIASRELVDYFEAVAKTINAKETSNWLLSTVGGILNENNTDIKAFAIQVSPMRLAQLITLVNTGIINANTGKSILQEMWRTGQSAEAIIQAKGLSQINDACELEAVARCVIQENPGAVADFIAGKTQVVKFLVGQVMRQTRGRASPNLATELVMKTLGECSLSASNSHN